MWTKHFELLNGGSAVRYNVAEGQAPLRFSDALRLWQEDTTFRSFFTALLAQAPFAAYRWETPPIARSTQDRPFELVLLDSPELSAPPDRDAFAPHFHSAAKGEAVMVFPNLGRDATLVVPCPAGPDAAYSHLGAFGRGAPEEQRQELWRVVGREVEKHLAEAPL